MAIERDFVIYPVAAVKSEPISSRIVMTLKVKSNDFLDLDN